MGIFRFLHTTLRYHSTNSSAMALLRKKTGYTLSNIRKALELNENDVVKAEKWLREQAKALGWNKVIKLQERQTVQGLIGIAIKGKKMAMVEVNCETDFVSRNEKFKSLVELVAKTCLQQTVVTAGTHTNKIHYNGDEIGKFMVNNNSLSDELALLVGEVGENATLKRAFCFETSRNDINIAAAIHPPSTNSDVLLGKYGAFVSYQKNPDAPETSDLKNIATDICTHIIGADPIKIGEYGKDEPSENGSDESVLIHQDFLFNDTMTVGQLLTDFGITILDFKRFQCGDSNAEEISSQCSECNNEDALNEVKA